MRQGSKWESTVWVDKDNKWSGLWSIADDQLRRWSPPGQIALRDNIRSIKILSHEAATSGGDGLTRAAAGAVLGFLVAGPIGTVLGAGAGAGGIKQASTERYRVLVSFKTSEVLLGEMTPIELEELRGYLVPRITAPSPVVETVTRRKLPYTIAKDRAKTQAFPDPIKGRKAKHKAFTASKLLDDLPTTEGDPDLLAFNEYLKSALDSYNTLRWRHYDREIATRIEVVGCIILAVSAIAGALSGAAPEAVSRVARLASEKSKAAAARRQIEEAQAEYRRTYHMRGTHKVMMDKVASFTAEAEQHERVIADLVREANEDQSWSARREHERRVKDSLQRYLVQFLSKEEFDKAWSNPLRSATISSARALRIIGQLNTNKKQAEDEKTTQASLEPAPAPDALEERLISLQKLLDKGLISKEEWQVARAKALGL